MERLPKLIPGWIMRYWYLQDNKPADYPDTSSEFRVTYDSEAQENAVKALEEEIAAAVENGAEVSVFPQSEVPENMEYGEFLGVYNVSANLNELTLANPNKVEAYTDSAVVMHYNEESAAWEKVPSEIIDGYVYATFESLSPVAVYTIRRNVYNATDLDLDMFVANGLPITIEEGAEGKVNITDVFGNIHEVDSTKFIVGGTYNEPGHIDEINVTMESGTVAKIYAGSVNFVEGQASIGVSRLTINGGSITTLATAGGMYNCYVDETNLIMNGGEAMAIASGNVSYYKTYMDANPEVPTVDSPSHVKEANMVLNDGSASYVYNGGSNGNGFVQEANLIINGGKFGSICGSSNGITEKANVNVIGGEIGSLQSVNRGTMKEACFNVSGGNITKLFMGAESGDATVNGVIEKVNAEIIGGTVSLHAGATGGVVITPENGIIESVKVGANAAVTYMDEFDTNFAAVIENI